MSRLRVGIDARILGGTSGGVESVILGLASALSNLDDGDEEYLFLAHSSTTDFLKPYLSGPCRILFYPETFTFRLKRLYTRITPIIRRDLQRKFKKLVNSFFEPTIPISNGTIEDANVEVMHFIRQDAFLTDIPSIYHPHDLLHVHFPELFDKSELNDRDRKYRAHSDASDIVAVTSSWVKEDIINQLGVVEEKVKVIPWAPVISEYPKPTQSSIESTRVKYGLPDSFIYYPAQTWPHKNHMGLIKALSILREKNAISIPVVFSGGLTEYYYFLLRRVKELNLEDYIFFLGYVSPVELRCLFKLSRCVVVPTKFEAASGPVWEAFHEGVPVACSNVTSLPRQAEGAALFFNPEDPNDIADKVKRIWHDDALCQKLVTKGFSKISLFGWEKTARHFRAYYRLLAKGTLSQEDRDIIEASVIL